MEPKKKRKKKPPVVDVTGDESKAQCCKEQCCIENWTVKSMNQSKLQVVKQEMGKSGAPASTGEESREAPVQLAW